jgi:hypothetical protein
MVKKGRKPLSDPQEKKWPVTIGIRPYDLDFIDACASELGLSRSQFITNIVMTGLDDVRLMKRIGFFKVVGKVRHMIESQQEQLTLPLSV